MHSIAVIGSIIIKNKVFLLIKVFGYYNYMTILTMKFSECMTEKGADT